MNYVELGLPSLRSRHRGNHGSIPSQVMRDLWCAKWHGDRYFSFSCQITFHRLLQSRHVLYHGAATTGQISADSVSPHPRRWPLYPAKCSPHHRILLAVVFSSFTPLCSRRTEQRTLMSDAPPCSLLVAALSPPPIFLSVCLLGLFFNL
jgi:hypothetical protein